MKKLFNYIVIWFYMKYLSIMTMIGIALKNTQDDILSSNPIISEKDKLNYIKLHKVPFINKMNQGQRDDFYCQSYYEILKKADKFLKKSSSTRIAQVADRFSMSLGQKDLDGKRYDHFGFYDEKHKYYGKTLAEAIEIETELRRLKDDDYELLYILNNTPIDDTFSDKYLKEIDENKFISLSEKEKAKLRKFPMIINRDVETINKIEQLTEFVHVKKIGFEYRMYEFFIPKKFKLSEQDETGKIFQDLINFNKFWFRDEYGQLIGFTIEKYEKFIKEMNHYDILKFSGQEIKNMNNN